MEVKNITTERRTFNHIFTTSLYFLSLSIERRGTGRNGDPNGVIVHSYGGIDVLIPNPLCVSMEESCRGERENRDKPFEGVVKDKLRFTQLETAREERRDVS